MEKNIVHFEIDTCHLCPHNNTDMNVTRQECREAGNKFLYWHGSDEEEKAKIPDWCPLLKSNKQ